jgi:hypothetical protein
MATMQNEFIGKSAEWCELRALGHLAAAKPRGIHDQCCPFADATRDRLLAAGDAERAHYYIAITESGWRRIASAR